MHISALRWMSVQKQRCLTTRLRLIFLHFYPNVTALRSCLCYRKSICRLYSLTFVRSTQGVETFGNISPPFCTLAVLWPSCKILRRSSQGNPSVVDVKHNRASKIAIIPTVTFRYLISWWVSCSEWRALNTGKQITFLPWRSIPSVNCEHSAERIASDLHQLHLRVISSRYEVIEATTLASRYDGKWTAGSRKHGYGMDVVVRSSLTKVTGTQSTALGFKSLVLASESLALEVVLGFSYEHERVFLVIILFKPCFQKMRPELQR